MTAPLQEGVAPASARERAEALGLGDAVAIAGGVRLWKLAAEDGSETWAVEALRSAGGERSGYRERCDSLDEALRRAMQQSARSTDPESVGGARSLAPYGRVTVNGQAYRMAGFDVDGRAMVRRVPSDEDATPLSFETRVDPALIRPVEEADDGWLPAPADVAEAEVGKPGIDDLREGDAVRSLHGHEQGVVESFSEDEDGAPTVRVRWGDGVREGRRASLRRMPAAVRTGASDAWLPPLS